MNRRLPVYLVLDCSESMVGEPFKAMTNGLNLLVSELRSNPLALETAAISIITFASNARQVLPLTDLLAAQIPQLKMGSGTGLGQALRLLQDCMAREVIKSSATQKGDYKPVVFIVTDGEPTDQWKDVARQFYSAVQGKKANIIGVACGRDSCPDVLRQITETVITIDHESAGSFKRFFQWVSATISTTSQKIQGDGMPIEAPPLPPEIQGRTEASGASRQVFLHMRCVKSKKFYLSRFTRQGVGAGPSYIGTGAFPLEDFEEESGTGRKVQSDSLVQPNPCPHCGNQTLGMCQCGKMHCCPTITAPIQLTCPWCGQTDTYAPASFDVGSGAG